MEELKEHIDKEHIDIVNFVSAKETNTNLIHKSEKDLGHKGSDNREDCVTVGWTKEMKNSLLREIDDLCNSSEDSDTDG